LNGINGNNVTPITGQSNVTLSNSSPTTCVNFGVIDQLGNMWGVYNNAYTVATGSYIEYINVINSITAPVISQFTTPTLGSGGSTITEPANNGTLANATAGGQAGGGLYDPIGIPAIDGAGNLWVANLDNTRYGGVSAFVPSINSTTGAATLTPLSPNGGICAWGFGNSGTGTAVTCNASGSAANVLPFEEPTGVDIDSSGNVWVPQTNGNVLGYIVGAAAPTVIPLAAQIANGTVGVKP